MLKLMLKRFLIAGAIFIFCILLIYLCGYFYIILTASFPALKPLMMALTYILCVLGPIIFVLALKMDNRAFLGRHSEHLLTTQKSFKNDCLFVLKSKEHIASLIVVNCIFVPMELSAALNANLNIFLVILRTLLVFIVHNIVFILLDCLLWIFAFYLKGKRKKKNTPPAGGI